MHRIFLRIPGWESVGLLLHLMHGCAAAMQQSALQVPSARQCSSKMISHWKWLTQYIQDRNKERGAM